MDADASFGEVQSLLAQKREGDAVLRLKEIAAADPDPFVRLKCLSTLRVVIDDDASDAVLGELMSSLPEGQNALLQIAGALRGLRYSEEAYSIAKGMDPTDPVRRLECLCLQDMDEYESALEAIDSVERTTPYDRVLRSGVLSALGEHHQAIEAAEALLKEQPGDFDARRAYVSALLMAGRDKEAARFVQAHLKEKSAEANALAGYAMRIAGKTKAAAGYATRALKMDAGNISAMETLGLCLAEKGEFDKARIVAGAINERSPGNRAAVDVLARCRRFSSWTASS